MIKKYINKLLENNLKLSVFLTIAYFTLILPLNESIAFFVDDQNRKAKIISNILKIFFGIFLFLFINFIIKFIKRMNERDKLYLSWFKYSLIYLIIMIIFFVLIYPGHWVWDEFSILHSVKTYSLDAWQNYFTNIYYTFCLYLIPTGVSVVIFQIIFSSIIVGYVTSQVRQLFKSKLFPVVIFLFLLMPPILINNFYPLRLTVYSYLELLLIAKLVLLYFKKDNLSDRHFSLIKYSFIITLLAFWRSEGVFYLLIFPVLIGMLGLIKWRHKPSKASILAIFFSIIVIASGYAINKYTSYSNYPLASAVNPLSIMLQSDLKGDNIEQRLKNIDKVLNLEMIKSNPSYTEVPAFWNGAVREGYEEYLGLFVKEFARLVIDNPELFIKARLKTFLATNGLDNTLPTPLGVLGSGKYEKDSVTAITVNRFYSENYLSRPINSDIKYHTTRLILMVDSKDRVSLIGRLVWSIIPTVAIIILAFVYFVFKRRFFWALICSLFLLRVVLIFFTAPAHYFMYYLPVYMNGGLFILLCLMIYFCRKNKKHQTKNVFLKLINKY